EADLEQGRALSTGRRWVGAHAALAAADRGGPLGGGDLELLARAAYMLGRDDEYAAALQRAHGAYLAAGLPRDAARCAWWIGHALLFRREPSPARGWFARGRRLLEGEPADCPEAGWVALGALLEAAMAGDHPAAERIAEAIAAIAGRAGDRDLMAIGLMEQGHAMVRQGRGDEGLRLVDESLVAVAAGELSPIVAGIVYCNTIAFCHAALELGRAREWTVALTRWCDGQPEMVAHRGVCLVHRAQVMTLIGDWSGALAELRRFVSPLTAGALNRRALGLAAYEEGEVHRLRGDLAAAEAAYRTASGLGHDAQPGLALARLAAGDGAAAAAGVRVAVNATAPGGLRRAALLPAAVEVMLAAGDHDAAGAACRELAGAAARYRTDALRAMAAGAHGAVALAGGDGAAAIALLRDAQAAWEELGAPYEAARAQAHAALAARALGDEDSAALGLEAARATLARLGAAPAVAWVDAAGGRTPQRRHGLTAREEEVLRLVAEGRTNREVAAALVKSERTVARHLQNIFAKLRVPGRTAATAYAVTHGLARPGRGGVD
ncbi:MAG TPA: LuxR C-terminal-related transcriptional regulator, partial [Miltoncostaeaceae bacterium]|nr:LuxR C-terminal-related transcriptional regulator [Miltoncostaeaceae bacterium]